MEGSDMLGFILAVLTVISIIVLIGLTIEGMDIPDRKTRILGTFDLFFGLMIISLLIMFLIF